MGRYDDIINLPRPISKRYGRMSDEKRAAQFSPFAALTGYEEAIEETARPVMKKIRLAESESEEINRRLRQAYESGCEVSLVCFEKDGQKEGGHYRRFISTIEKVDMAEGLLTLSSGEKLRLSNICAADLSFAY